MTTIVLRLSVNDMNCARSNLVGRRLALALPALVAAILVLFASGARGAAADYPSPLYLSAAQSSEITASESYELLAAPGLAPPSSGPSVTATAGGSLSGSYRYVYTFGDPVSGETARSAFTERSTNNFFNLKQFTVSASGLPVPDGTPVRLYRASGSDRYNFLVELAVSGSAFSYLDNTAGATVSANPLLGQAENRVEYSSSVPVTGYAAFDPGVPVTASTNDNSVVTETAPTTPSGRGWLVDAGGNVGFAAGTWTLTVQTKSVHANGVAHLVVGIWKVTTSGGSVGQWELLLDPNDPAAEDDTNLITSSNVTQTISHAVDLPAFTLASDERLYVQFWRRQTSAYTTSGGIESRIAILLANDGVARLEHPAVSTLPGTPTNLRGWVDSDGATLRWDAPAGDPPAEYVIYVNGAEMRRVDASVTEEDLGPADPTTAFSVAAANDLGNVSPPTSEIVRPPKLRGLRLRAARDALGARGLSLGTRSWARSPKPRGRILAQAPRPRRLIARGSDVDVVRSDGLIYVVSPRRLRCVVGGRLKVRAALTAPRSSVSAHFYTNGRWDYVRSFETRAEGTRRFRMRIPYTLERPTVYWVLWKARTALGTGKAWVRIDLRRLRAGEDPWPCVADD